MIPRSQRGWVFAFSVLAIAVFLFVYLPLRSDLDATRNQLDREHRARVEANRRLRAAGLPIVVIDGSSGTGNPGTSPGSSGGSQGPQSGDSGTTTSTRRTTGPPATLPPITLPNVCVGRLCAGGG